MCAGAGCDGVMLARAAIRNPWVFRDFLPGAAGDAPPPGAAAAWDGGRCWPNAAEVDAAAAAYAATAAAVGTKPKFVAFHERNFERRAAAMPVVSCAGFAESQRPHIVFCSPAAACRCHGRQEPARGLARHHTPDVMRRRRRTAPARGGVLLLRRRRCRASVGTDV